MKASWRIVEYQESMGEIVFPEGFEQTLVGLDLEAQVERFRTVDRDTYGMTDWRERTITSGGCRLELNYDVRGLIVKEGMLVGVILCNDNGREVDCLVGECVCTYYDCENNGGGYKTRIDYTYLVCRAPEEDA